MYWKNWKKNLSAFDQMNQLPDFKNEFPEFKSVNAQCLKKVIDRLDNAYKAFFRRVKEGKEAGFPRFKSCLRYNSFVLSQNGYKLDGRYLKVTGVGIFKLHLSRPIEGKIKTITIKRSVDGWHVTFLCDSIPKEYPAPIKEEIGIDVGLKLFCVDSDPDSKPVENPRFYRKAQATIRTKSRKVSRRTKGSNRRKKAAAILAKAHAKVANMRKDFLHKVANQYIRTYQRIYVEALKIENMLKNRHLSKSISDAGWGMFFTMLTYKAEEAGRDLIKVNPQNTSQLCSNCGEKVPKTLAVRVHNCKYCGISLDRDLNAALNILQRGVGQTLQVLT